MKQSVFVVSTLLLTNFVVDKQVYANPLFLSPLAPTAVEAAVATSAAALGILGISQVWQANSSNEEESDNSLSENNINTGTTTVPSKNCNTIPGQKYSDSDDDFDYDSGYYDAARDEYEFDVGVSAAEWDGMCASQDRKKSHLERFLTNIRSKWKEILQTKERGFIDRELRKTMREDIWRSKDNFCRGYESHLKFLSNSSKFTP